MKKRTLQVLLGVCGVVFVASGVVFYQEISEYNAGEAIYEKIDQTAFAEANFSEQAAKALSGLAWQPPAVDLAALQADNDEIVGWITLKDTAISYPLLQSGDNEKYLTTTADGQKNKAGAIFLDYRNDGALNDWHSVIYGHNLRNKTMFSQLSEYVSPDYWREHDQFSITLADKVLIYDIFAAYVVEDDNELYTIDFKSTEDREDFLIEALERSVLEGVDNSQAYNRVVTLSTCTNVRNDERFVVHGRLKSVVYTAQ